MITTDEVNPRKKTLVVRGQYSHRSHCMYGRWALVREDICPRTAGTVVRGRRRTHVVRGRRYPPSADIWATMTMCCP